MKITKPRFEILACPQGDDVLRSLELIGRVCYKSEERITEESAKTFMKTILSRQHESVIEHFSATVRFICDRGVSHELVRHRLASFTQESTRYVNYQKREMEVIEPPGLEEHSKYYAWHDAVSATESAYKKLIEAGVKPQIARSVLPTCLKTEIVVTANFREWRHIFKMRCPPAAHPQMRELMVPLLWEMHWRIPVIFDDLVEKEIKKEGNA
jgi:thymidylate synthase (FAD)